MTTTSAINPATETESAPAPISPVIEAKVEPKVVAKRVVTKSVAVAKSPAKVLTKTPAKVVAGKPVKTAVKTLAKVPALPATKVAIKTAVKPSANSGSLHKTEKPLKTKKPKLVRDSFTIPKVEYIVLDDLKQRANKMMSQAKKSELIRAGIKALAAMSDAAFLAALNAVPAIKTGRPSKIKAD